MSPTRLTRAHLLHLLLVGAGLAWMWLPTSVYAEPRAPGACRPDRRAALAQAADFDVLWHRIRDEYAYWDAKTTDWAAVRLRYRDQARNACDRDAFIAVLERTMESLYDNHAHLNVNLPSSTRLVPSGLDVWAEWRDGKAIVTQVRADSPAAQAGLRPGTEILAIQGVPVAQALATRLPEGLRTVDDPARQWALLALLAGRHDQPRRWTVRTGSEERDVAPDEHLWPTLPRVEGRRLEGDIGYVRINDLGAEETVGEFDAALAPLMDTRGLVLDLRNIAAGGNTEVAEPILGRFIAQTSGYQVIVPRGRPAWVRRVAVRPPRYDRPLVVLVGRWTASMGEGMAIGLDGMRRATLVGTRMAGLRGAVVTHTLPRHHFGFTFPFERLRHLDGTPREQFVPPVLVDELTAPGGEADPVLAAGLRVLEEQLRKERSAPSR
ncbi:MAG TPA: S41 family peptidase [Polyangia bacterium]|jgi:carboxyl-terminal processing protease|nr:S41 family peptidase [Polyangia bacterium]